MGACLCIGLLACGGGGGGGSSDRISVRADTSSVSLEVIPGGSQSASASIQITLESAPGTVFPRARVLGTVQPYVFATITVLTDTAARIDVGLGSVQEAGSYTGSVLLDVCADAACDKVLATFSYAVTLRVHARFGLDVLSLSASTPEGVLATLNANLSIPDLPGHVEVITRPTYLQLGTLATGPVVFTVDPAGLAAGSYGGDLTLMFIADNGLSSQFSIPVSLNVTAGIIVPADLIWTLNQGTASSALSASVAISRADGAASAWSASSDVDWLLVTPNGASLPAQLNLSIDAAKVNALANDIAHTATVTLAATNLGNASFHVVLDKRLPVVGLVTPTLPGQSVAQTYTLAGRGFNQLTQPLQQLRVAGGLITPSSVQVLSDRLISAQLPALAPGSYAVDIVSTSGLTGRAAAQLHVADSSLNLPSGFFPFGGLKHLVLHDPVRNAIYAFNRFGNQFLRYTVQAGSLTQTVGGFGQPVNAAVGADGLLYATTLGLNFAAGDLLLIDPDNWQVQQRIDGVAQNQQQRVGGMSITADGRLWLLGSSYWDLTDSANHLSTPIDFSSRTAASLDGKAMVGAAQTNPIATRYNVIDGTATLFNTVPDFLDAQLDRDGSHLLLDSTLYNAGSVALGQLAAAASNEFLVKPRLSANGTRIYAMVGSTTGGDLILRVDVFDTAQTEPGTDRLLRLRSITLPVSAVSSCSAPASPAGCQSFGDATVSADGRYYIVAGDLGILVVDVSEPTASPARSAVKPASQRLRWQAPAAGR